MGHFYNVRGFLDCDDDEQRDIYSLIKQLKESIPPDIMIDSDAASLYRKGWCFREATINWVNHVFYGGSLRANGKVLVFRDLTVIAQRFPEIEGKFFVEDDEGEFEEIWLVSDGNVTSQVTKVD